MQYLNFKNFTLFSILTFSLSVYASDNNQRLKNRKEKREMRHENVNPNTTFDFLMQNKPSQFSRDVAHLLGSSMGLTSHEVDVMAGYWGCCGSSDLPAGSGAVDSKRRR